MREKQLGNDAKDRNEKQIEIKCGLEKNRDESGITC